MGKEHKISEAEWYVIKTLWMQSPLGASDIIEALRKETDWNPKTIHTLISRLVAKGVVGVNKDAPCNLYFPLVSEEEYKAVQTDSFIKKVYNGSIKSLVANFIKEEKLTKEELAELKQLLNDRE
ncbi:MAG: BlaI/MecI/CopY family transcriptional regulator [Clostridia bacterium]|nr:BlaI/MecI/CopY family transcriptional regulator [Clostridia bacterium]